MAAMAASNAGAAPDSAMLDVHGASLYYEVRGTGPMLLMIPGGPADADGFRPLAELMSPEYTVVTYDCRGNSRSPLHGSPDELTMEVFADDAASLIEAVTDEPAYVLGSSGGASYGLELVKRHPRMVRTLVAHEPPVMTLLPDAKRYRALNAEVKEISAAEGVGQAMRAFLRYAFGQRDDADAGREPEPDSSQPDPGQQDPADMARIMGNLRLFTSSLVVVIGDYLPDIDALRASPARVVVGLGTASTPLQLPYRTSRALAERLGTDPEMFPGGHTGFVSDPAEFAVRLREVLAGAG
jgi:pimeloyl-ACP methyl ester carboxylesterase